jgi:urease accessory protein
MDSPKFMKTLLLILSFIVMPSAHAHTGHSISGFIDGLVHPFGADHLLAMVAVGFWSASTFPRGQIWFGPAIFLSMMLIGACLASLGLTLPFIEVMIAMSVIAFGALIVMSRLAIPNWAGLVLLGSGSFFHGFAHGVESTGSAFWAYSMGFLLTTAMFHITGAIAAFSLANRLPKKVPLMNTVFGVFVSGSGFYFLINT